MLTTDVAVKRKLERPKTQMERRMPKILEKYWTQIGQGDRESDVEKENRQLYQISYIHSLSVASTTVGCKLSM